MLPSTVPVSSQSEKKKKIERLLAGEFLEHMGVSYKLRSICSVPDGLKPDGRSVSGPDVKVTCRIGGQDVRIGIELTEYQVDATSEGSKGRRWEAFFWRIQRHLAHIIHEDS